MQRVCESAWRNSKARSGVKLIVSALAEGAGTCRDEPKEQNLRLRSLLDEAGMSNKGLARRVVDLAATQGLAERPL